TLSMSGAICAIFIFLLSGGTGSDRNVSRCEKFHAAPAAVKTESHGRSALRVGDRRQQRDFRAARIKTRVLHDDRYVPFQYRRIVGIARDRRGLAQIVETKMQWAARADRHAVRADGLPVGEENGDLDMRLAVRRIEDACGLVRDQSAVGKRAFGGYI